MEIFLPGKVYTSFHLDPEVIVKTIKQEKNVAVDNPDGSSVHSNGNEKRKEIRKVIHKCENFLSLTLRFCTLVSISDY